MRITVHLAEDQIALIAESVARMLECKASEAAALLPVPAAAEFLGVAPKTIRNMLSDGRLSRHGRPRRPLVARAELEELVALDRPRRRTVQTSLRRLPSTFSAAARSG